MLLCSAAGHERGNQGTAYMYKMIFVHCLQAAVCLSVKCSRAFESHCQKPGFQ